MAETWVINESLAISGNNSYIINFVSNNESYDTFAFTFEMQPLPNPPIVGISYVNTGGSSVQVYTNTGWANQAYRTVTFDEPLDLTTQIGQWFSANAEKQEPPQTNITLDLSTLSLPTGTHSIQIRLSDDGVTKRDSELSNAVTYVVLPQLATPQNPVAIASDGTDFAFEPVENAESYEIFADGVSIGECEPEPEGET